MKKISHDLIIKPIVTEASTRAIAANKYSFKVCKNANKIQIKKALEELFGVKVKKVNTMNCKGRYIRYRYSKGYRPDWKKAIVTLTEDSKSIEFFDNLY
jgi:large subunit ribosomal protein L23